MDKTGWLPPHGEKMECITCGAPGRFDGLEGHNFVFENSIWWNRQTGQWECHGCWDK